MIKVTDTIRIRRWDTRNLVVEQYETITNNKTKEEREDWVIFGYCGNVRVAINIILKHDLMVNHSDIHSLLDYQEAFDKQVDTLKKVLEKHTKG